MRQQLHSVNENIQKIQSTEAADGDTKLMLYLQLQSLIDTKHSLESQIQANQAPPV